MLTTHQRAKVKLSADDRIYFLIINLFLGILLIIMIYPLIYIASSSFSSASAVLAGRVVLWPVEISIEGYQAVFRNRDVLTGYANSTFYAIVGTLINVSITLVAAYPLSRREIPFAKPLILLFTFTLFFNGGLIPNYILMKDLHLIDKRLVMLIPGAINVFNLIITRSFLQMSIPEELRESAQIDGCDDFCFFFKMILPLSKAIIAVIGLYYAVGHWNAYFNAFIYLNNRNLYPLQLFLREILVTNSISANLDLDPELMEKVRGLADLLKYSLIIIASAPLLVLYPFVQKHFIKGVMIGSLKG